MKKMVKALVSAAATATVGLAAPAYAATAPAPPVMEQLGTFTESAAWDDGGIQNNLNTSNPGTGSSVTDGLGGQRILLLVAYLG